MQRRVDSVFGDCALLVVGRSLAGSRQVSDEIGVGGTG
jgi:hypothetical protein